MAYSACPGMPWLADAFRIARAERLQASTPHRGDVAEQVSVQLEALAVE